MPGCSCDDITNAIGNWKSNTKVAIVTLLVTVLLEAIALICTIVFAAAIDEEHNSIISLIMLIVAILYQLVIAGIVIGAIRAKWIHKKLIKFVVVAFLILLGNIFHLPALVLMIVTTTEQSTRGHIAFGGLIASLDFIIVVLQFSFCISLSFAIFRQHDNVDDDGER